jgi:hypothetical protein
MIAFEVIVNGQKRFTAGGDFQALNALLTLVRIPMPKPDDVSIFFRPLASLQSHSWLLVHGRLWICPLVIESRFELSKLKQLMRLRL